LEREKGSCFISTRFPPLVLGEKGRVGGGYRLQLRVTDWRGEEAWGKKSTLRERGEP